MIRNSTASSSCVQDVSSLVGAFEGVLIRYIDVVASQFRQGWNDLSLSKKDAGHGVTVLNPFIYARLVHALGHKTLKQTEEYVKEVLEAQGILSPLYTVKIRPYRGAGYDARFDRDLTAQYGNAYYMVYTHV